MGALEFLESGAEDFLTAVDIEVRKEDEISASDFLDQPEPEEKSLLQQRREAPGASRGVKAIGFGALKGTQSFYNFFDDASTLVSAGLEKLGLPHEKGNIFKTLSEMAEPPEDWTPKDLSERIVAGLVSAGPEIGLITAVPGGLATIGATRGGASGGVSGALKGGAEGALLHGVLKGLNILPKPASAVGTGGTFGALAAAEGGDVEDIAEAAGVGIGLGGLGGKKTNFIEKLKKRIEAKPETEFLQGAFKERFLDDFVEGSKELPFAENFEKPDRVQETPVEANTGTRTLNANPISALGEAYTKAIGSPVWDKLIMGKVPELLDKIPGGKSINRALDYTYRGDLPDTPKYLRALEDQQTGRAIGQEFGVNLGNRLTELPEQSQLKVANAIKGEKETLNFQETQLANESKNAMFALGKQAVDAGLLNEQTFWDNAGKYMPRLYKSKEFQENIIKFGKSKTGRIDTERFKKRKDIPKEIREEMGEILTPGFPIAKGITQLTHSIELSKFFNGVASNRDWAIKDGVAGEIPKEWEQLSKNEKLGDLKGAYVHPEIHKELTAMTEARTKGDIVWRQTLGAWKFGKVILSPKTHARNLMSNSFLAHLGGMPMYEQPVYLSKAVRRMKEKGELWQEAKKTGLLQSTFTNAELRELFDSVEIQMKGAKATDVVGKFALIDDAWQKAKGVGNKASKLYEAEEQVFKMAKFIHNVERKKMNFEDAAADAEKWLFNYGKLTKFQENYRSKWYGAPFATFTFKMVPRVMEAAVKTPWRFALPAMIVHGIEQSAQDFIGDTDEQEAAKRELLPPWMQGEFAGIPSFARVPILDDTGREHYLNLSYTLPWGDIAERGGGFLSGLMPFSQPVVDIGWKVKANWDSFWNKKIVEDADIAGLGWGKSPRYVKIMVEKVLRDVSPTPILDLEKMIKAYQGHPDSKGRFRETSVVLADVLAGIKMYPVDYTDLILRKIDKIHPGRGFEARQLKSRTRTLKIQRDAIEKKGGNTSFYDIEILGISKQIEGLILETQEFAETADRAIGR